MHLAGKLQLPEGINLIYRLEEAVNKGPASFKVVSNFLPNLP